MWTLDGLVRAKHRTTIIQSWQTRQSTNSQWREKYEKEQFHKQTKVLVKLTDVLWRSNVWFPVFAKLSHSQGFFSLITFLINFKCLVRVHVYKSVQNPCHWQVFGNPQISHGGQWAQKQNQGPENVRAWPQAYLNCTSWWKVAQLSWRDTQSSGLADRNALDTQWRTLVAQLCLVLLLVRLICTLHVLGSGNRLRLIL